MKKKQYMLCIDNGLSVGKAALVDGSGKIAGVVSFKTEIIHDSGYSEIDMDLLSRKTLTAVKEVIQKKAIDSMVRIKSIYKPDLSKNNIYMKRFSKFEQIKQLLDK